MILSFRSVGSGRPGLPRLFSDETAASVVVQARSAEILQKHLRLPNLQDVPPDSLNVSNHYGAGSNPDLTLEIRRKRLVYRSKQRGWLEVDLLLGTWASENVPTLNADELDQFEDFVNLETIDIYNVITLRLDVPENLKRAGGGVVERIQGWARANPLGKADPGQYKEVKQNNNLI
jgi:succinate dehydrogenase assembly factor 2